MGIGKEHPVIVILELIFKRKRPVEFIWAIFLYCYKITYLLLFEYD